MSLDQMVGTVYGPSSLVIPAIKVREYVDATGDDPRRWRDIAPPSYAAALLFVVAPSFIHSEQVRGKALVHSDQTFRWHAEVPVGESVTVRGEIDRVRTRGETSLVTLSMAVTDPSGASLLDATSVFLVTGGAVGSPAPERPEPAAAATGNNESPGRVEFAGPGPLPTMLKSASRVDLVRYAGASGDFNPIHWDHSSARAAGLAGTVVHGLLTMAWASQLVAAASRRLEPIAEMSFRFRQPVFPAENATVAAEVTGIHDATATLDVKVVVDSEVRASGSATVRR
jgi:acyl dehydratase